LSCFLSSISTCLFLSIASTRAMRRYVECGMITSVNIAALSRDEG
jgi:hypothetical protein